MIKVFSVALLALMVNGALSASARVTRLVMVDESGKELHVFKRGINDDFAVRDTIYFSEIGTRKVTIKADVEGSGFEFVNFKFNNKMYPDTEAPYAMQGNDSSGRFNPVQYLATASDQRSLRVELIDSNWQVISDIKLRFILADGPSAPVSAPVRAPVHPPVRPPVRAPVHPPMAPPVKPPVHPPVAPPVEGTSTVLYLAAAGPSDKFLGKISDGDVIDLASYSDELTAVARVTGPSTQVKFFYDHIEKVENIWPYVMSGDNGRINNPAPYLNHPGKKSVRVEVYNHGKLVDKITVDFSIKESKAPVSAPVPAPVMPPVKPPVMPPVKPPVRAPYSAPVPPPTPPTTKVGVTKFKMVDEHGKVLHTFVRGIDSDFAVRDTIKFADIGTNKVTIVAEVPGQVTRVKFFFNNKVFPDMHAPFAMQGDDNGKYPTVPYLSQPSRDLSVRARLFNLEKEIGTTKLRFIME